MDWRTSLKIYPVESVANRAAYFPDTDWSDFRTNGAFVEIFFQVEEAATLTHIGVGVINDVTSGVGGFPGHFLFTLQGISASGIGDGVIKASAGTYTPVPSDAGTFLWLPLLASYGALRGEEMCLRIEKTGGGGTNFLARVLGPRFGGGGFIYQRVFSGVVTNIGTDQAVYGYRSAARRYGFPIKPDILKTAVNAPGQTGMRFLFSDDLAETAVLSHITWVGRPNVAAGGAYDVVVIDDEGNELSRVTQQVSHGALTMSAGAGGRDYSSTVYFEDAPEIVFGREYFVVLQPASGTQSLYVAAWDFNDTADASALGGEGEFYAVARAGTSGSFTRDGNARPMIDLGFFDWGVRAPPQTGFHLKFFPRYNDNALIEHADDQVVDPRETVDGEPHEAPGFPIGGAIKSYCGFATVEVFKDPLGVFDSTTRIFTERPIEELKMLNWDPFLPGDSHIVFRLRAVAGSPSFVDYDQYTRLA
jgi:hypothetical protein